MVLIVTYHESKLLDDDDKIAIYSRFSHDFLTFRTKVLFYPISSICCNYEIAIKSMTWSKTCHSLEREISVTYFPNFLVLFCVIPESIRKINSRNLKPTTV